MRTVSRKVVPAAVAVATVAVLVLQGSSSRAETLASKPSIAQQVQEAKNLGNQIDALSEQYDSMQIQLAQAKAEVKTADLAEQRAQQAMTGSQKAVAQLAAMGYMNGGVSPTMQMLTSSDPSQFLNQASTVQQLDNEAGMRVSTLQSEQTASKRAEVTAKEEIATADTLQKEINSKVATINSEQAQLKNSVSSEALAEYQQTGSYPASAVDQLPGSSLEVRALDLALDQIGKPYVWGAAGPDSFDCSGLVVYVYGLLGVSLPHYTGSQWNLGTPVSYSDLQPGDLVFFYSDISHVGIYIGTIDGVAYMVDAPATGQDVSIQPLSDDPYVGARRIS